MRAIPACRWLHVAAVAAAIAVCGFMSWVPAYLIRECGLATCEVGVAVGLAAGIACSGGVLLAGWLADRVARRA